MRLLQHENILLVNTYLSNPFKPFEPHVPRNFIDFSKLSHHNRFAQPMANFTTLYL